MHQLGQRCLVIAYRRTRNTTQMGSEAMATKLPLKQRIVATIVEGCVNAGTEHCAILSASEITWILTWICVAYADRISC